MSFLIVLLSSYIPIIYDIYQNVKFFVMDVVIEVVPIYGKDGEIDRSISVNWWFIQSVASTIIRVSSESERRMQMSVEHRIRLCLLIDKMNDQKDYSKKLGLENRSKFHGERIWGEEKEKEC